MKLAKSLLKSLFSTGKKPTQQNYADWMDSFVHLDDQAAVDGQIVSQLLITYDQAQKTGNSDGHVNSLGDVFKVLEGLDDNTPIANTLGKANWVQLTGRPAFLTITDWTEQEVVTDTSKFDPQPRQTPNPGTVANNPAQTWALALNNITSKRLMTDIKFERRFVSIPNGGSAITFYTDMIVAIKIAVTPKVPTN